LVVFPVTCTRIPQQLQTDAERGERGKVTPVDGQCAALNAAAIAWW